MSVTAPVPLLVIAATLASSLGAWPISAAAAAGSGAALAADAEAKSALEICGGGTLRYDANSPQRAAEELDELEVDAMLHWRNALMKSPNPRARAAGWEMNAWQRQVQSADLTAAAPDADLTALVQLAAAGTDPAVYAIALSRCSGSADKSADGCASLSAGAFTQLDPDNAVPWLLRAAQARQQQDLPGEQLAMERAARAGRSDLYVLSLYEFAQDAAPAATTALDRKYLFIQLLGVGVAGISYSMDGSPRTGLPLHQASAYCSTEAVRDTGTRERCAALADIFASHARSLLEYAFGMIIGKRAGWSESRIRHTQELLDAMQRVESRIDGAPGSEWSCEALQRLDTHLRERTQLGELGAARALVEQSGRMPSELADEHRVALEALWREAQTGTPAPAVTPWPP